MRRSTFVIALICLHSRQALILDCTGYENVSLQTTQLAILPAEITSLHDALASLRARETKPHVNPSLSLPLPATLSLLASRQVELDAINEELEALERTSQAKQRELDGLHRELGPIEAEKAGMVREAKEARRRKEGDVTGFGNDLELRGRWYMAVETGLREMLGVDA